MNTAPQAVKLATTASPVRQSINALCLQIDSLSCALARLEDRATPALSVCDTVAINAEVPHNPSVCEIDAGINEQTRRISVISEAISRLTDRLAI